MVATVGALMFTQTGTEGGLAMVTVGFMLFNGGCAPMVTLGNGIVMSSVAPEKAGSAAALSETSSELGFSLGIAALGSIGTAVYRSGVAGSVPPLAPATVAAAARDTLAGAVASGAFLDGYHVAATVCVAVLAWRRFRHLRPLGEAQRADGLAGAAGEASAS